MPHYEHVHDVKTGRVDNELMEGKLNRADIIKLLVVGLTAN